MIKQVYQKPLVKGSYDALVIGSGIGGLSVAALLAKSGRKVLVLERHYVAGGFTHTFSRKGYEWDVGLHYVGEVHRRESVLRKIFDDITDNQLVWSRMPAVYDKAFFGDPAEGYDFVSGTKNFVDKLSGYFPEEKEAIKAYVNKVYETAGAAKNFFGQKALPPFLGGALSPFLKKRFLKYSNQTTKEVIGRLTSNPKLLGVLTAQYGDYGLPPSESSFAIHALVAKHYMDGGNYPVGGSGSIARAIAPVIEKSGGAILVRAEVKEIIIHRGKAVGVRLSNGDEINSPIVVSDAGVINTFNKLISRHDSLKFGFIPKLKQVAPSLSHICLYIGMKSPGDELELGQANYWIYPSYDHDENIRRYRADSSQPLPVTYISFPSAKDSDWPRRHPQKSTMEVIGFAPYEWFKEWEGSPWMKRGDKYEIFKEALSIRLLTQVYRFLPQIKGKIDHYELSTPLSTRHFCNYDHGEIYGIDHTPQRFNLKWLKPRTPVRNLYLTGQDIVSDGIGGALFSGVLTASAILGRNVLKDILKRAPMRRDE